MEKVLNSYVPRHLRLGVSCDVPVVNDFHEVVKEIPIVDNGSVVRVDRLVETVPAIEDNEQYVLEHFRLSAMVRNGVPLKVVNINSSNVARIDQLEKICQNIDDADKFVSNCVAQQNEKKSWFTPFEESNV